LLQSAAAVRAIGGLAGMSTKAGDGPKMFSNDVPATAAP
jgi:hypothetical protein